MMATTHAAMGLALAAALYPFAPELASAAAVGAIIGGLLPDLDVVFEHRKSLHYPVFYGGPTVVFAGVFVLTPSGLTAATGFFFLSAWLHSATDIIGGPPDLRPWERTTNKGVYVHALGRWVPAREFIRYDGAPEDLLLLIVFALPGLVVFDGVIWWATVTGLVISAVYVLLRKQIPDLITTDRRRP